MMSCTLLLAAVFVLAAPPASTRGDCPAGFRCFADPRAFAAALTQCGSQQQLGTNPCQLALACSSQVRCSLSGARLVVPSNSVVQITNVDVADFTTTEPGGLVYISTGASVAATNCSFRYRIHYQSPRVDDAGWRSCPAVHPTASISIISGRGCSLLFKGFMLMSQPTHLSRRVDRV